MAITRRVAGQCAALVAGFLLTVNAFHILRSQMIEVDVPLTCLIAVALWRMLILTDNPTMRNTVFAAVAIGLATATKYTGALLVIPFLMAHVLTLRAGRLGKSGWRRLGLAAGVAAITFFVCSPYVILDYSSF